LEGRPFLKEHIDPVGTVGSRRGVEWSLNSICYK